MKRAIGVNRPGLILMLLWIGAAGASDSIKVQKMSAKAPAETAQFGQLVGNWRIRDFAPAADGGWTELGGADWNFYWILGGAAIQDDWIAPGMGSPEPEKGRQYGTNIRIYNPKEKRWEMAWASNTGSKVDTFLATHENGSLVMKGIYNGGESRISFHDIGASHFSWKMEQKDAETGEWVEVYRIEAERVGDQH